MRSSRSARTSWRWMSALPVLLWVTGCASCPAPKVTYVDRPVQVPVPVVQPLPADLLVDCAPAGAWPTEPVTVKAVLDRLGAVSDALVLCRGRLAALRNLSTSTAPAGTP